MRQSNPGLGSSFKWRAGGEDGGRALDAVVSAWLKVPLGEAAALIDFGSVYVGGRIERNPARTLAGGEEISVSFPAHGVRKFYEVDPARILFRDRFLLAYDKEPGIPSQQTPSDAYNNLFAALLRYLEKEGGPGPYAALHHRLDMETSGVMLFALDKEVNRALGAAFEKKRVRKEYLAWVEGVPGMDEWTEDSNIGKSGGRYGTARRGEGRTAVTVFRALHRERDRALVLAQPLTGRTHQIRIHLAARGHPVVGDRAHGAKTAARLFLHAFRLSLKHPANQRPLILEAPLPPEWPLPPGLALPPARPA
ncbi:MAG: RluA family pseudouridine synthase [Syntrophobacteraceae bacterium]